MPDMPETSPIVRFATPDDLDWCLEIDHTVSDAVFIQRKIGFDEVLIAEVSGRRTGYLRLEYLWSVVPYIGLIYVLDNARKQGVGRAILSFLESYLRAQGHTFLLSSSQVDEPPPQAWHRHMGFVECGILTGINPGGVGEVFFRKPLL
jgi:GNAT superfamily N-acetyltransferase